MITIAFSKNKHQYKSFIITGHAGFNKNGYDIVCAAVSSAVMLTINGIKKHLEDNLDYNIYKNKIVVKLIKTNKLSQMFCDSLYNHLIILAKSFPRNIRVIKMEVRNNDKN